MRRVALIVLVLAALVVLGLLVWLPSRVEPIEPAVDSADDAVRVPAESIERDVAADRAPLPAAAEPALGARPVELVPDPRTRELFGAIQSEADQHAIPGARAQVLDAGDSELASATSDDSGVYRIAIPTEAPSRFDLLFTAAGYAATRDQESAPWSTSPRRHDVGLEPACSYAGRVVANGGETRVAGAVVTLRRRSGSFVSDVREEKTAPDGSFEFQWVTDVPHGEAQLYARCEGYAPALLSDLHRCRPDAPLEMHVLELHEELRTSGRVVDALTRVTVRGAEVRLATTRGDDAAHGEWVACDADGRFDLRSRDQPAQILEILARAPGYNAKALRFANKTELELDLFPPLLVRGRVVDAETGGALQAGSVRAWRRQSGPVADDAVRPAEIALDGFFALPVESVPEYGWLEIEVAAAGYCARRRSAFLTPAMQAVDFALEPAVRVRGRVVDGPEPVDGAIVTWCDGAAREDVTTGHAVHASHTTDPLGAFDLLVPRRRMQEGSLVVQWLGASNAYRLPELGSCASGACEVTVLFSRR